MASGLGVTLGPVQTMNENQSGYWPSGMMSLSSSYLPVWGGSMTANTVQNAGGEYYPLEGTVAPGQIAITSQVSVVFALK